MPFRWSRRCFVRATPSLGALGLLSFADGLSAQIPPAPTAAASEAFPAQDPALIKEIVGVSHGDLKRVRELVEHQPALARASFDWGFGDWETCIDAASHVGRREIADFLITNGARPTLFTAAMLGDRKSVV